MKAVDAADEICGQPARLQCDQCVPLAWTARCKELQGGVLMSSDPTTADTLGTSRRHDPDDLTDSETAADKERPNSADPFARVEAEHADEHPAVELGAEATQRQPLSQDTTDGPHEPIRTSGAPDEGVWVEAPAADPGFTTSHVGMTLNAEEIPQPLQETVAPAEDAPAEDAPAEDALDGEGQPEALTPLIEGTTPELISSDGSAFVATASAQVTPAPAPETNGAEPHAPSPAEPVPMQDAESTELTATPERAIADRAPLDSPYFEPAAGYPVQPTWAQQPTYADAQPWGQQPMYAEPVSPLPEDLPAVPWADSSYALPIYAPPPSGYAQPMAQSATGYAPAVYAPPAPARQHSRWPLVLGTVTAVLVVAALAVALASYGLNLFGRPLYQNGLTSVAGGWPNDAECHFKDDGYHINSASNCYYSGADYRDVTISVTTRLLKGDPTGTYGIAFRRPSQNNFYQFLITGNGNWLVVKNDITLQKATPSTAIKTGIGALNKLSVHLQGSHFTFFANGAELGSLSDDTYPSGKVGLAGDAYIEIVFTDFTVTRG